MNFKFWWVIPQNFVFIFWILVFMVRLQLKSEDQLWAKVFKAILLMKKKAKVCD